MLGAALGAGIGAAVARDQLREVGDPSAILARGGAMEELLKVPLEMFHHGGVIKVTLRRQFRNAMGPIGPSMEHEFHVDILPGYKAGTRVKFDKAFPPQTPPEARVDVAFLLQEVPHDLFRRKDERLLADLKLTKQHLRAEHFTVSVQLLSGELVAVQGSKAQCPHGSTRVLKGYGMPIRKAGASTGQCGDLTVRFVWPLAERANLLLGCLIKPLT